MRPLVLLAAVLVALGIAGLESSEGGEPGTQIGAVGQG